MKKNIFILVIILSTILIGQIRKDGKNTISKSILDSLNHKNVLFDVHVGYGTFNGGRIGARYFARDNLSIEMSYGRDWVSFIGLSDEVAIYSIGLNWKYDIEEWLTYSLNFRYQYHFLSKSGYFGFSPSIGAINFKSTGFDFWYRAGIFTAVYSSAENRFGFYNVGINLDLGFSFKIR